MRNKQQEYNSKHPPNYKLNFKTKNEVNLPKPNMIKIVGTKNVKLTFTSTSFTHKHYEIYHAIF